MLPEMGCKKRKEKQIPALEDLGDEKHVPYPDMNIRHIKQISNVLRTGILTRILVEFVITAIKHLNSVNPIQIPCDQGFTTCLVMRHTSQTTIRIGIYLLMPRTVVVVLKHASGIFLRFQKFLKCGCPTCSPTQLQSSPILAKPLEHYLLLATRGEPGW